MAARDAIRHLLDPDSVRDALVSYYAFHHDPNRTELFLHHDSSGKADGFILRARTGHDIFRPLVTLRATDEAVIEDLFRQGLEAGRPYYFTALEPAIQVAVRMLNTTDLEVLELHRLDPARYETQVNVMVTRSRSVEGWPLFRVISNDRTYSTAGLNWLGPKYAEVYVYTEAAVRGRGWGRAVVNALVGELLRMGRTPLYAVDQNNAASQVLARAVGFVDTGLREYACTATRLD